MSLKHRGRARKECSMPGCTRRRDTYRATKVAAGESKWVCPPCGQAWLDSGGLDNG